MSPRARGILACLAALSVAACVARTTRPYDADAVHAPATEEPAIFHYEQGWQPIADEARPDLATKRHSAREITWASVGDNGQPGFTVKADYYRSKTPGMHPLVIVLPLWGTYTYPPQKIAEGVRDRGRGEYHVLRVLGENYLFDWDFVAASTDGAMLYERAARMSERMRVTVIDVRRLIDWAQQQPEIDPQRIGLVGFSMSAIVGGLVAGADDRLGAAVLVMGGANLHDIIATCDGPLRRVRETVLPRLDITQEQYHAIVEEAWGWLNPTHFPTRIDPSRILYFDAQRDECMSQEARNAFWETLGEPRRVSFHYGHKHSFLAMTPLGLNYMRRVIYRFIDRTLQQDP